ncbi:hypothetical protein GCM10010431_34590 [Streptomyces kunmingensis]
MLSTAGRLSATQRTEYQQLIAEWALAVHADAETDDAEDQEPPPAGANHPTAQAAPETHPPCGTPAHPGHRPAPAGCSRPGTVLLRPSRPRRASRSVQRVREDRADQTGRGQ